MRGPSALRLLLAMAAVRLALHTFTNGQYGFHRDELAFLEDARHLDWGYPAYPPLTPFLARIALELFGAAPAGVRFFAALAQCGAMVLTGLIARELNGGPRVQAMAALAVAVSPLSLIAGHLFQYVSFDFFWSVLLVYIVARLVNTKDSCWLVAAGATVGAGMMTRYTMAWVTAGLAAGLLLTPARRHLRSVWLLAGATIALAIVAPLVLWQYEHGFLALEFTRTIHQRDVEIGRTDGFLWKQFLVPAHLFTVPLWIAGLWFYFRRPEGERFRVFGWAFIVSVALYAVAQAREYYTAPLYPMLLAAGACAAASWSRWARGLLWGGIAVATVSGWMIAVPMAPPGTAWFRWVVSFHGDLAEEVGWPEFAEQTAAVYRSLPEQERAAAGILAGNFGEAGALNLYGPALGLPRAMARVNSFWLRGYDRRQPQTLVVTGVSEKFVGRHFQSCELRGTITNRLGVVNEETRDAKNLWVCRGLREPWPEFWRKIKAWS